jgi:hypothetical protein
MNLGKKKALASRALKVGKKRIVFIKSRLEDIKEAKTGFLIGKKITKDSLEKPIADFGMIRTTHKTKVFAFLRGLVDAGIDINCKEEAFPKQERIKGENLKSKIPFDEIKSKIEKND